jgi:uncharacterized membrane protein YeaQ/YmgE (transglycosylase-associated protein family)
MFSLIGWIVCGLIAGSIAEWFVPLDKPSPGWQTIAIGVAGSIVGGMVNGLLTGDAYSPAGLVWSVIGAVLCLFVYRSFAARGVK